MNENARNMPGRGLRILIWSLVGFQAAVMAGTIAVAALDAPYTRTSPQAALPSVMLGALALLVYPAMGVIIFLKRPGHPIGWLFCAAEAGWAAANFTQAFGLYAINARPDLRPLAEALIWFDTWPGSLSTTLFLFLILLFPDGKLPSPRWKPVAALFGGFGALSVLASALAPGPADPTQMVPYLNPLGISGPLGGPLAWFVSTAQGIFAPLAVVAAAALVLRFRSARQIQREQLKWLAVAIVLVALCWMSLLPLLIRYPTTPVTPAWALGLEGILINSQMAIPIAAAIAILRYRLYEIDRIINQALVYFSLTAALALVYFVSVLVLQAGLSAVTGEGQSSIVTVLSTLAIAALFTPLRRRFQQLIDRRFYRQKYNTQRILDRFSGTLRNEVDLQMMSERLLGVVDETFQPNTVSLWVNKK